MPRNKKHTDPKRLKDEEHVTRHVKKANQRRSLDDTFEGFHWFAFDLITRDDVEEQSLSINCIERADNDEARALKKIKSCLDRKRLNVKSGYLAVGNIGLIKETFKPHPVRMLHNPEGSDPSYSSLRGYPAKLQRQAILERLAAGAWSRAVPLTDV